MNDHAAYRASRLSNSFFSASLAERDPEIAEAVKLELGRQRDEIELIASENIVSRAVLEAQERVAEKVKLPGGYRIEWVGEFGNLKNALQRLAIAVPIAIPSTSPWPSS